MTCAKMMHNPILENLSFVQQVRVLSRFSELEKHPPPPWTQPWPNKTTMYQTARVLRSTSLLPRLHVTSLLHRSDSVT